MTIFLRNMVSKVQDLSKFVIPIVPYGEVEEVMSEFNTMIESMNANGMYRAARAAKK